MILMRFVCYTVVTLAVSVGMYANDVGWVTMNAKDGHAYDVVATVLIALFMLFMLKDLFDNIKIGKSAQ